MTLSMRLRDATSEADVGGKARNLAMLIALGAPVPDGVVLTSAALNAFIDTNGLTERLTRLTQALDPSDPEQLRRTADAVRSIVMTATLPDAVERELATVAAGMRPATIVAVRSSAIGEDGVRSSFAGQFDTILNVSSASELRHAVMTCWASSWAARALFYRSARQLPFSGMGVIVQRQVNAALSGVLFTRAPEGITGASADDVVIEWCEGLGDALVSGRVDPHRLVVARDSQTTRDTRSAFPDAHLRQLTRLALDLETHFDAPQDIEWTFDTDGALWILQTRPITTLRPADVLWSNANVNENFPRPISPLLYSIAAAGYYHYFRNLGVALGVSRRRLRAMDRRLRGIIGVHGARMYYNLTNIHAVLRMAPFGAPLAAAFNQFVGVAETAAQPADASAWRDARGRALQAAELSSIAAHAIWQFSGLGRRVRAFERRADRFAARMRPEALEERTAAQLAENLQEFLDIRCHRWKNASLADAAAMMCYALLQRALASEGDATHTRLLRGLPGVPSSVPPVRLWELSRLIRSDASLRALFDRDAREILAALQRDRAFTAFNDELRRFLDDCGFRSSAELMLNEPSLQEDPLTVIELLKGYVATDGESPSAAIARQSAERHSETRRLFRDLLLRAPWRAAWTALLLGRTQRAVSYRERVRLKQALLYNRCRAIALAIGSRLAAQSFIAHRDDVFMLTVSEIGDLVAGRSMFPYHVRDLIALRKRQHDQLAAMQPPDTIRLSEGAYLRPDTVLQRAAETTDAGGDTTLVGTSACGGSVTAPAAVLADVREAHHLTRGDVLVTRQTDPGWAPVFCLISGLVIERGGMLSHGAIIAREFGLPCVVGVKDATRRIEHGALVTVDGDRGLCSIAAPVGG